MKRITKGMADNFARAIFGNNAKFDYVDYYESSNHVIDFGIGFVQLNIYQCYGEDAPFAPKGVINPFGYINVGLITVANVELLENGSVNVTPYNYECGLEGTESKPQIEKVNFKIKGGTTSSSFLKQLIEAYKLSGASDEWFSGWRTAIEWCLDRIDYFYGNKKE